MAVTYKHPDVEVYQKFITPAVSIATPVLQACIVGHSWQIVEDEAVATLTATQNRESVVKLHQTGWKGERIQICVVNRQHVRRLSDCDFGNFI